jgi:DNA-binding Xre family transcriptional regulator
MSKSGNLLNILLQMYHCSYTIKLKGKVFMEDIQIVNRLQEWRKKKGFTQKKLSKVTGISLSTIRKLETNERKISKLESENFFKISKALEITMEQLISEEPD